MAFFKPSDPAPFTAERYPVWTVPSVEEHWYGFPISLEGLVKLADDAKGPTTDPDVDRDLGLPRQRAALRPGPHSGFKKRRTRRGPRLLLHQHPRQRLLHRLDLRPHPHRRLRQRSRLQIRRRDRPGHRRSSRRQAQSPRRHLPHRPALRQLAKEHLMNAPNLQTQAVFDSPFTEVWQ